MRWRATRTPRTPSAGAPRRSASTSRWPARALFGLLGVRPELGRFYDAEEDRIPGTQVAVLSHAFWTRHFGRDAGILGRELRIGPGTYTVVGVAPPGFTGATIDPVDVWLPLVTTRAASSRSDAWRTSRSSYWFEVVARLRDGREPKAVEAEATAAHRAGREDQIAAGRYDPDARVVLGSVVPGRSPNAGSAVAVSRLLAGVALLVMLIACANVANLLFLRGVRRRREMAIRVVLGIPRRRLFLHLLLESLTLAAVAGVASILAARWGGALVYRTLLPELDPGPSLGYPHLLGFAGLAACISALLAGLAPAALASRPDLHRDLGGSGHARSSSRMRSSLLVLQVAISVVLLAGAGLFLRSLDRVHDLDLGFVPDGVVVGNVETARGYVGDVPARAVTDAMERLRTEPGIEAVAVSSLTPFEGLYWGLALQQADGESISLPSRPISYVISPDYFRVMGMRLVRGRGFTPADAVPGAPPVLVLSEGLARRAFGLADPLGKCLLVEQRGSGRPPCSRVVGILADHRAADLVEDASLIFYLPVGHPAAQDVSSVVVRGSGGTPATLAAVRTALLDAGSDVRYASVRPLVDQVGALGRSWRLGATLFALFGGLALSVAALGLHAIVSFEMAQRRREMGIRSALGAERGRLVAMVFRFAVLRASGGAVLGLTVVIALAGAARDLLFRTSPEDPIVLAASCLTLVAVAAAAAVIPSGERCAHTTLGGAPLGGVRSPARRSSLTTILHPLPSYRRGPWWLGFGPSKLTPSRTERASPRSERRSCSGRNLMAPSDSPGWYDTVYPSALREAEARLVVKRRAGLTDAPVEPEVLGHPAMPDDTVGVALSGGGIRSATFCLGVFRALARAQRIRRIDFLSTVSGGGYFGSFLGAMFVRQPVGATTTIGPEQVEAQLLDLHSKPVDWLRENGRYMSPNGSGDTLRAAAVLLRNWIAVLVVLSAAAVTAFAAIGVLLDWTPERAAPRQ